MRILFLSQLVPFPPDAGPKIRIYYTIRYLVEAGHQVTLLAFKREDDDQANIDHLKEICHAVHSVQLRRSRVRDVKDLVQSFLSNRPFLISRDDFAGMHQKIENLLAQNSYDAIHADQLWMAQYALAARNAGTTNGRLMTVLDQHNSVFLIPLRLSMGSSNPLKRALLAEESRRLADYERETCQQFDHVVWVTAEDQRAMKKISNKNGYLRDDPIIPICVDPEARNEISFNNAAKRVTFLGGLHWPPNSEGIRWFYHEVWAIVQKKAPDSTLTVIGKHPPSSLVKAQRNNQNIEVSGYSADPNRYLEETAAFIVPLHAGGGMRVKIVDAWSWGLPVVSTAVGAEGINSKDGDDILIADSPEEFADAVLMLLQDREYARILAKAGRKSVELNYDWRQVYKLWDQVYPR
ncbi:MAG: glycosyltransferase family 4 protein [Anaerolineae bacterium]|nr:MAG: glycosyltransferase family 4 protein [Anaerolineae bacterium]